MSDIGPASLSVGQTVGAFLTFLPKLSEVRKADPRERPDLVGDVRLGEVAGLATAVAVGVVASSLTGSPVPIFASVFMAGVIIVVYETALRSEKLWEPQGPVERSSDA